MKSLISIATVACFFVMLNNIELTAQTTNQMPMNHLQELKDIIMAQNQKTDSILFATRGVSNVCCEDVFLIIPEDQSNPGYKVNLPLGVNLKPIMEGWITGAPTTMPLTGLGDATGCATLCGDQLITDWHLTGGSIFGVNITYGNFTAFEAENTGDFIFIGRTQEGCFVVDVGKVTCDADTVFLTDPNSTATLQLDICESLTTQLQATSLTDLSNVTFDLAIAPNPTSTIVKVLLDEEGQGMFEKIQVVSMTGHVLLETTNMEVNISTLPSATYIARIVFQKSLVVNQPFVKIN